MLELFHNFVYRLDGLVLGYFLCLNLFYLLLLLLASRSMNDHRVESIIEKGVHIPRALMKPFSVLVPTFNDGASIVDCVQSLVGLDYPEHEVVVCNDGSTDHTLESLIEAFELVPVDVEVEPSYRSKPIQTVYFSKSEPKLVVLDKKRGGKSDALNAAASIAKYPYVCMVDADSILSADSMRKLMRRFVSTPDNVVVSGVVRVANGCTIDSGHITHVGMPGSRLERIQVVEYLRAFLFERIGWSRWNMLMMVSGAFTVWRQDILKKVGGWRKEAIGENVDLVLRVHRFIRENHLRAHLSSVPGSVCWTHVPMDVSGLSEQRSRWQRGLTQSLLQNIGMLFNPRFGRVGLVGFPYFFIFEMLGGLIECVGLPLALASYFMGVVDLPFLLLLFLVAVVWGLFISFCSIALSEAFYHRYTRHSDLVELLGAGLLENFGYRQLHSFWRCKAMIIYLFGKKGDWGSPGHGKLARISHTLSS